MKTKLNFLKTILLFTVLSAMTSCIKNEGNTQTFNNVIGSIILDDYGQKVLRLDVNGIFIFSTEFEKYNYNDRILASFTINYDKQTAGFSFYTAEDNVVTSQFLLKQTFNIAAVDTFKNDTIKMINSPYITEFDNQQMMTIAIIVNGSSANHTIDLVTNSLKSNSDTLKLEIRHNKNGDTDKLNSKLIFASFYLTPYLSDVASGSSRVIEILHKTESGNIKKYNRYYSSMN